MTSHFVILLYFLEVIFNLDTDLCAGFRCAYFLTSGDKWLDQKGRSDGTDIIFLIFVA